jgi:DNA-directed RNA polymerase sigma subunit (sigma70/sigma32)
MERYSEVPDIMVRFRTQVLRLDADEQRRLTRVFQAGDNGAGELLVRSMLAWVIRDAKRYARAFGAERHIPDLVQVGALGVMKAAKRYSADRGAKFSTYADFWIRAYIVRYLIWNCGDVRLPDREVYALRKALRAILRSTVKLKREPSTAEALADGVTEQELSKLGDPVLHMRIKSLSEPRGEDGDGVYGDTLPDPEQPDIVQGISTSREAQEVMGFVCRTFGAQRAELVAARYGIKGYGAARFQEAAESQGITRVRAVVRVDTILHHPRTRRFLKALREGSVVKKRKTGS